LKSIRRSRDPPGPRPFAPLQLLYRLLIHWDSVLRDFVHGTPPMAKHFHQANRAKTAKPGCEMAAIPG
jgi:hypothetical protein